MHLDFFTLEFTTVDVIAALFFGMRPACYLTKLATCFAVPQICTGAFARSCLLSRWSASSFGST